MRKTSLYEGFVFGISRFVTFFLLMCFVVTCTMLLFLWGMELDEPLLRRNALLTFLFIVVLTTIFCGIDAYRRRKTVDQHLERILSALEKITHGDFSVRLPATDLGMGQEAFRDISDGINRLAKELSGVETLRTDFIASVSHELKTPLASVQNYARLLQDPALPEERRQEYAAAISRTTRRLAELVSNILKLNKLENQRIFPEAKTFDLGEQLCSSILEFETALDSKGLELECDLEEEVLVRSDPELLALVWSNLFSNAIKFTPPGGKIGLSMKADGRWANVAVSDTGCGMTRETGARIFEKFYQGDTSHASEGNGLGLALVKRVVDITGGAISVSSTPGKGSTFTVRLERVEHEKA